MWDVESGIGRHLDTTFIQVADSWKLIPCFRTFREAFSHPYIIYLSSSTFSDGFSPSILANATSLDTILPEICAFIVCFSCTVWTIMRSLVGTLAEGVLAGAILIPPC